MIMYQTLYINLHSLFTVIFKLWHFIGIFLDMFKVMPVSLNEKEKVSKTKLKKKQSMILRKLN